MVGMVTVRKGVTCYVVQSAHQKGPSWEVFNPVARTVIARNDGVVKDVSKYFSLYSSKPCRDSLKPGMFNDDVDFIKHYMTLPLCPVRVLQPRPRVR